MLSQIYRLERVAGFGIIASRRRNIAHLHRPWRATVRQGTLQHSKLRRTAFANASVAEAHICPGGHLTMTTGIR
jgi:hypothetical protein